VSVCQNTRLMHGKKSPTTKGRIEIAFARLDRLESGEDDKDVADARRSTRRVDLFALVISVSPESVSY